MDIIGYFYGIAFVLGAVFAVLNFRNKRKREDERMKNIIKQAIDESKKND